MSAMYDGTVTHEDPNPVTTFELDDQTTAYVVRDVDAPAPDWDGIGFVVRLGYARGWSDVLVDDNDPRNASNMLDAVSAAWERFNDHELVARYLRIFHGAVSVDYSMSLDRDANVCAVVTADQADRWGTPDDLQSGLAGDALEIVRMWYEGDVYGVIVVNTETGEQDSCWGVYDSSPNLDYCHTVAADVAPIGVAS